MMDNLTAPEIAALASATAAAVSTRGEYPLREALVLLRSLGCTGGQAAVVLAHGLAHGLFVLSPSDATLRPPRREVVRLARAALAAVRGRLGAAFAKRGRADRRSA